MPGGSWAFMAPGGTPAAMSAALLLEYLGHSEAGHAIEKSVKRAIQDGHTTSDLGGTLSTSQVGDALLETLSESRDATEDPSEQEAKAS